MISERTFARSFSGFWTELLPLLTPNFVHLVSNGFKNALIDADGEPIVPVPKDPEIRDTAVIAEFAFFISQLSIQRNLSVYELIREKKYSEKAEHYALEVVKKYEGGRVPLSAPLLPKELEEGLALAVNYERFFNARGVPLSAPLLPKELEEGLALAVNYERFFNARGKNQIIEFGPSIPGAGFLAECKADISVGTTLFEVKTVDRNLAGKDIRQLVVYLALQGVTGNRRWVSGGFFNPRRAIYHEFNIDYIINQMSGGKASLEVFQELIDFVSIRDIQLDATF